MFCSNCGKEIRDNSNFCPYCGVVKRAIPSETIKQTPVQDTFVSTKKNGSKAFKFCPNCGKAIGENSDFCPYCGSAERAIPSKTVEQTPVQNTSVTAWQSRFKDFWRRKWSEDKGHVVGATLLILSIVCIMVYSAIKHRQEVYIETLADAPEKFVGRDICTEGWVTGRSEEDWIFAVSELPPDTPAREIVVAGWALEKLPEVGDAVSVRGEWEVTEEDVFYLEADEVDYLDLLDELALERALERRLAGLPELPQ